MPEPAWWIGSPLPLPAYKLGANGYVVKPAYAELLQVVRRLKDYWIDSDGPPPNCQDWLEVTVPPPAARQRQNH